MPGGFDDDEHEKEREISLRVKIPLWVKQRLEQQLRNKKKVEKLGRKIATIQIVEYERIWKKRCETIEAKQLTRKDLWNKFLQNNERFFDRTTFQLYFTSLSKMPSPPSRVYSPTGVGLVT